MDVLLIMSYLFTMQYSGMVCYKCGPTLLELTMSQTTDREEEHCLIGNFFNTKNQYNVYDCALQYGYVYVSLSWMFFFVMCVCNVSQPILIRMSVY